MDHGTQVAKELASAYLRRCNISLSYLSSRDTAIELGLRLGKILCFICLFTYFQGFRHTHAVLPWVSLQDSIKLFVCSIWQDRTSKAV